MLLINRFGELKNVISRALWYKIFKEIKRLKSSQKSRGVFRTQASIYDGAFCVYT